MLKILIIDDTKSVHTYVKMLLAKTQCFEFVDAYHGQEGLELLKSGRHFDLVLLDWEMPIMNGIETLQQLQSIKNVPPILMMTTKNEPEDIFTALNNGASDYLMKPFTLDIILEKIVSITGQRISHAA